MGQCHPTIDFQKTFCVLIFVLNTIWNGVQNKDFSNFSFNNIRVDFISEITPNV